MPCGKPADVGQAVRHLAADGVEVAEVCRVLHVGRQVVHHLPEALERFRRLREEGHRAREVELFGLLHAFYHHGLPLRLSHQSEHLGMPAFPVDHDLRARFFRIHLLDAPLQLEHHGARGVDDFDAPLLGQRVRSGRFAVCAQQHLRAPGQRLEFGVPDGLQSQRPQPFALAAVVYDVAQAAERVRSPQFLLGLADGRRHPEAEAR